jgi:hypothetical protein
LVEDWLVKGWANAQLLLADASCFWPLPGEDLHSVVDRPVGYAEAAACSQALFSELRAPAGDDPFGGPGPGPAERLFTPGRGTFWTEHAERNAMPSAAAAEHKSADLIGRLGRWGADCKEGYVRTTRVIVMRFQRELAQKLRRLRGGDDFLGEEAVLEDFAGYCGEKGFDREEIDAAFGRLRWFAKGRAAGGSLTPDLGAPEGPEEAPTEVATPDGKEADLADSGAEEAALTEAQGYVVSVTGRRQWRRLHYVGRCWRIPGRDYRHAILHGELAPDAASYDAVCRACWKDGAVPEVGDGTEGSGTSSSSSADEEGEGAPS